MKSITIIILILALIGCSQLAVTTGELAIRNTVRDYTEYGTPCINGEVWNIGSSAMYCRGVVVTCYSREESVGVISVPIERQVNPGECIAFIATIDALTHAMVTRYEVEVRR